MAKILAIDDDVQIRSMLDMMLKRKGHHVFTAGDGQKGIDVFKREHPDVTILDFEMPDMDGLTVLQQIRGLDSQAPVIMLTGAGTAEREQQARQLGVTEFLAKGFSLHELGAALNQVVQQPAQNADGSVSSKRLSWKMKGTR
jgi:two-component system NtrC family response regulator/two-component system response regulator AtoC